VADPIPLSEVAARIGAELRGDGTVAVSDVTHDSREAGPGILFCAVRGFTNDGHDFVGDALAAGSPAVCVEDPSVGGDAPALVVASGRDALGPIAAVIHRDPSETLRVVGITGTNGKTTTTHILESIASASGIQQALIGTVGARINGKPYPVERTTPEASDFQRLLAEMAAAGVDVAAVEVSSHALALGRVAATRFAIGAFTNLSQDHLDFHADMEEYYAAKARLLDQSAMGVVWVDDPAGARMAAEATIPIIRVGIDSDADVRGIPVAVGLGGSTFDASGPGGGARIHLSLPGRFNMANALVAAACANALGIEWDTIADGIGRLGAIPGRFEVVDTRSDCTVVVDYAHTPEGVATVVATAQELVGTGRVIAVVGAGGDRDRDKRPVMGAAAATADLAIITSDNPRSEDPTRIVDEVMAGANGRAVAEVDRRRAIRRALDEASGGDVVLILGKGHEQTQEVAGTFIPFDDRDVAREEASA
jgi:UDP-N-acetylmuramoyl-L-alanyl-D-glutamate--2,6-diaminopimelate ligase